VADLDAGDTITSFSCIVLALSSYLGLDKDGELQTGTGFFDPLYFLNINGFVCELWHLVLV
jgi:hypothetical protein